LTFVRQFAGSRTAALVPWIPLHRIARNPLPISSFEEQKPCSWDPHGYRPPILDVLDWVRERLSRKQIAFLLGLPASVTLRVAGLGEVFFCHATPHNDIDFFTDVTPDERLAPVFADVPAAAIVCGHSHLQFERFVGDKRVINAGSAGMAYEDEPGAYWALLGPTVELRRSCFTPASLVETGYPRPWPTMNRAEARRLLEADALGAGDRPADR
jgi:hypothetical protein